MKTILLISPYWREAHRWMISTCKLADLWQRLGYRVVVVCMGSESGTVEISPTLTVHMRRDFFLADPWNYGIALGFTGFVRRVIRREKPDIIVANKILFWTSLSVLALRLTGHRVTVLTDALVGITWWPRRLVPKLCAALYAWTLGWLILLAAERIVFFHPQPATVLRRLGIAAKCTVIPTGIDPTPFLGPSLRTPAIVLTYIGRLESVKGVDDFLAAAVALKRQHAAVTVQVVGWFTAEHPLVREYGADAEFTGLRDDIPAILQATDIFVLPSYSEGLSNALMEAMASGCACVASDVGGNAFLIENGVSGLLFPAGDRAALQAHLRRLVEDPAKRASMGDAARKRIAEEFSWEMIGKKYGQFFAELTIEN